MPNCFNSQIVFFNQCFGSGFRHACDVLLFYREVPVMHMRIVFFYNLFTPSSGFLSDICCNILF